MPTAFSARSSQRVLLTVTLVAAVFLSLFAAVTPASAAQSATVQDSLGRTVSNGWGAADSGTTWSKLPTTIASVHDGKGWLQSPGSGRTSRVSLPVSVADAQSRFTVTVPTLPAAGLGYFSAYGVRVSSDSSYVVGVRVLATGAVEATIERRAGFTSTTFQRVTLPTKATAGSTFAVSYSVTGTNPVSLSAKVWPSGAAEPAASTLSYSDSSSTRLQAAGGIEFTVYTAPNTPTQPLAFDDLSVVDPQAATPTPTPTPTPPVTEPVTPVDSAPVGAVAGARQAAGAAKPGTRDFPVPAQAVIVAPNGDDAGAGTTASPLKTVAAALKKVASGGTIALRGGSYHESIIIPPQKKVTLQPYRSEAVWLDGAEQVGGWRAAGGVWVRDGWTQSLDASPTFTKGAADGTAPGWQFLDPAYPMAAHPDQLWLAGTQLTQVASRGAVTAGTFYVDESADQLVLGSNPSAGAVEASTLTTALSIRSASLVQGIGVRRFATSVPQMGSVTAAADDVTLSQVTIQNSSTTGFYTWSKRTTLTNVSLFGNGLLGMGAAHADGLVVKGLLSTGNNSEHFNRAPVSGAMKIHSSNGVTITNSVFADNFGQGPWFDVSNTNVVFSGNDSLRNTGNGFVYEISQNAVVANNLVAGNGVDGILIVNSGNVSIWNNTSVGNTRNININMNSRRSQDPSIPWITQNVVVGNNVFAAAKGDCVLCVDDYSKSLSGNQMVSQSNGNLYYRTTASAPKVFAYYAGSSGFGSLADFTRATGRDSQSVLVDAPATTSTYRLSSSAAALQGSVAVPIPQNVAAASGLSSGGRSLGAVFP